MATGELNIAQLATSAISATDFIAKADTSGLASKNTITALSNFVSSATALAFRGVLLAADATVTQDGIYVAGDSGTYTNNGGLVVSVTDQIVLISVTETQTVFEQAIFPISLTIDPVPTIGSTNVPQSGGTADAIKVVQDQVTKIAEEKNLFNLFSLVDGSRIDNSGNIFADALWFRTLEAIPVTVGERYSTVSDDITNFPRFAFYTSSTISAANLVEPPINVREKVVPATATHMVVSGLLTSKDSYILMQLDSGFPTLGQNTFIYKDVYTKTEVDALVTTNAITAKVNLATGDDRVDVSAIKGIDGLASNDGRYNIYTNNKFKKPLTLVQGDNIESNITPSDPTTVMSAYSYVDASTYFPYVGNAFKGTGLVGFSYMGITIPQADLIKDSGYLNSDDLHVNIEFYAAKNSTVTIQIYENNGTATQLGSNITKAVTTGYNVLQFDIAGYTYDADLLHFEIRFFDFGFNIFREQDFYFGRINVFSGATSNLLEFDYDSDYNTTLRNTIKKTLSNYYNFKGSFLGDSLTFQRRWIKQVCEHFGISFDSDEIVFGLNGFDATGVGGSTIVPFVQGGSGTGAGQSIYMRADDVFNYNPEIIFLFGGQNDNPRLSGSAISGDTSTLGTIDDAPYTGGETAVLADVPSFYAALKGIIVKLLNSNPNVPIVMITPSQNESTALSTSTFDKQKAKRDAIIEVGSLYALPVVDLFGKSQINELTYTNYLYDDVHFNYLGGDNVSKVVISTI